MNCPPLHLSPPFPTVSSLPPLSHSWTAISRALAGSYSVTANRTGIIPNGSWRGRLGGGRGKALGGSVRGGGSAGGGGLGRGWVCVCGDCGGAGGLGAWGGRFFI